MDILILIFLVTLFLGLLILIPLLIIKTIARMNSAQITIRDAWKLYLRKSARKPIFQALSIAQKNNIPITIEQIETHWFASGNPVKIIDALANNSGNKEITFQRLSAIDLAGKDIDQAIEVSKRIHRININDFQLNSFKLDYQANYKLGLYSIFGNTDPTILKQKIMSKLNTFAASWDSEDPINTHNFLRTNILTSEYWERVLNVQLIDQNLHIKV